MDFLKLLYDRMLALHLKHADTADEWRFPRPSFKARIPSEFAHRQHLPDSHAAQFDVICQVRSNGCTEARHCAMNKCLIGLNRTTEAAMQSVCAV